MSSGFVRRLRPEAAQLDRSEPFGTCELIEQMSRGQWSNGVFGGGAYSDVEPTVRDVALSTSSGSEHEGGAEARANMWWAPPEGARDHARRWLPLLGRCCRVSVYGREHGHHRLRATCIAPQGKDARPGIPAHLTRLAAAS